MKRKPDFDYFHNDNLRRVRSSRAKYEFDVWLRGIYRIASKAKF
jgi:hypothetical protein